MSQKQDGRNTYLIIKHYALAVIITCGYSCTLTHGVGGVH